MTPLVHAAATWSMAGVIWFVQLVHYPLFADVSPEAFPAYQTANIGLTARMLAVPMLVEALAAARLAYRRRDAAAWAGLGLLTVAWASTAFVQFPTHASLALGFDAGLLRRLLSSNWVRTAAWSARGVIALRMLRG